MNSKRVNDDVRDESSSSLHFKAKKKFKLNGGKPTDSLVVNINPIYMQEDLKKQFSESFKKGQSLHDESSRAEIHNKPFTCCVLPNFVADLEFLDDLQSDLLNLDFQEKSNDLYKFHQSQALQNVSSPSITALKNLLYRDFAKWLTHVTGISFTETIDMTCACYEYTDILLCHDDELEGRRIAFIFYLVPPWKEQDGGSLDLFDLDDHGQPRDVVKSLLPKYNNLLFFEVSPISFHQVAEVLSKDKCRLSISGWFHGETFARAPPHREPRKVRSPHQQIDDETFYDWINPSYFELENQSEIMDRFQEESEIQLEAFFKEDKYLSVIEALRRQDLKWKRIGPANKRRYEIAEPDSLPGIVQECLSVMRCEMMFLLLCNFTALKLHPLAPEQDGSEDEEQGSSEKKEDSVENRKTIEEKRSSSHEENEDIAAATGSAVTAAVPSCQGDVRRWQHGDYTLLHDTDNEGSEFALDAIIYFNCKDWDNRNGGFTSYVAKGEDEELLSVKPQENCLSLVYRDKDTLRFVKHINERASADASKMDTTTCFHDIAFVYYE